MGEKREVTKKKIEYEGPFDVKDLYGTIEDWSNDYSYKFEESKHSETVKDEGKNISYEIEMKKDITDYAKFIIATEVKLSKVQNITLEIDGKDRKLHKGKVEIEIKGKLETDKDSKWDKSASRIFFRAIFDKFIMGSTVGSWDKTLKQEVEHFKQQIEAHLNLFKFK